MGKYRQPGKLDDHQNIKWAPENGWCISLGVPIGNDLDETKWWSEKINATRKKTLPWLQLKHNKFFGRNLIVQGCFFGRLRYWLYSIYMNPKLCEVVQRDADILWWSRDPTLETSEDADGYATKNSKRIRRWIDKKTAVGPVSKGGLNVMEWRKHAEAFYALWPLRYLDPGDAAWKTLVDSFLLKDKKGEKMNFPEGRTIILQNLSTAEKSRMLSNLPKKAQYLRACFRLFWQLKLKPKADTLNGIGSESPWHGHRFGATATNIQRRYCKHVLQVTQMSDFMNKDTNRPFTRAEWRGFVEELHTDFYGVEPTGVEVIDWANYIYEVQKKIPREIWVELLKRYDTPIKAKKKVYLVRGAHTWPAIIIDGDTARLVKIDAVGRGHKTQREFQLRQFDVIKAQTWNGKWAGPEGASYACDVTWDYYGIENLSELTIQSIYKRRVTATMRTPECQTKWSTRLGRDDLRWDKIWGQKSMYTTPRDKTQIMRLQRRNLWVAQHGGCDHTTCAATGCNQQESQLHLVECPIINREFWEPLSQLIQSLGLRAENSPTYWITGTMADGKRADSESWAMVTWAWRSLYACTTKTHLEGARLNFKVALMLTFRYAISRTIAHGRRWKLWFTRQEDHHDGITAFPLQHRSHELIEFEVDTARYHTHPKLPEIIAQLKSEINS